MAVPAPLASETVEAEADTPAAKRISAIGSDCDRGLVFDDVLHIAMMHSCTERRSLRISPSTRRTLVVLGAEVTTTGKLKLVLRALCCNNNNIINNNCHSNNNNSNNNNSNNDSNSDNNSSNNIEVLPGLSVEQTAVSASKSALRSPWWFGPQHAARLSTLLDFVL